MDETLGSSFDNAYGVNMDQIGRIMIVDHKGRPYSHHCILDGKGGVIHVNKKIGKITIDPLEKVLRNAKKVVYLEDDFNTRWITYRNAKSLVGTPHKYRFLTDNCETWVNKVRTGQAFSKQMNEFTHTLSTLILAGIGIYGIGSSFISESS